VPLTLTGVSRLLGGAIDLLVHVARTTGGCRQITEISRLVLENGSLEARPVFVKGRGRDATGSDATGSRL
jgi:Flp pilus assembly CpaF family ATPase